MAEVYEDYEGWEVSFDEGEEAGGSFKLLDPGYYPFKVTAVEKGFTNQNPPHKCLNYTFKVGVGPDATTVTDRIAMHAGAKWKQAQLLRSVGARKHGEKGTFDMLGIVGMTGWLEIEHREYTRTKDSADGKKKAGEIDYANNIKRYIDPEDAPADGQPVVTGGDAEAEESWA
ncbi:MAG: hypothetical protein IJ087_14500 [Eggerthellaceae bacterium]|nr:hypothetical protein [Eggerthellaceae bacterium]